MKVSIVTISYNQGQWLERAMRSVISQDYPNLEYIVVDPGSTDGSRRIIERYRASIQTVILEPDKGPADGLNKGFSVATGDVFAFINADDILLRGAVSHAVARLEKYPLCGAVAGRGYLMNQDGIVVREIRPSKISPRGLAFGVVTVLQQGWFIRRPVYEAVGGFNIANRHNWDYELLLEISLRGVSIMLCDFYSGIWMYRPDSVLHSAKRSNPAEYLATKDRLFKRVMGRPRRPVDTLERTGRRIGKWLVRPDDFLVRTGIRDGKVGQRVIVAADGRVTIAGSR